MHTAFEIVGYIVLAIYLAAVLILIAAYRYAPYGHEDEGGFHLDSPPRRRKDAGKPRGGIDAAGFDGLPAPH